MRTPIQERLKDEYGGQPIHHLAAAADAHLAVAQNAARFGRGKALIPEVNGQLEVASDLLGEPGHPFRLWSHCPAHAQRVADHNLANLILLKHAGQGIKIGALVPAPQGLQALGGDAQRIRNGHADGLRADVEGEDAPDLSERHASIIGMGAGAGVAIG